MCLFDFAFWSCRLYGTTACEKPLLTGTFLFLSTFFIQVLSPSYKLLKNVSIRFCLKSVYKSFGTQQDSFLLGKVAY